MGVPIFSAYNILDFGTAVDVMSETSRKIKTDEKSLATTTRHFQKKCANRK